MTISATTQGIKPGVCTSTNRPANPYDGQVIYETDTDIVSVWNGSAWKYIGPSGLACVSPSSVGKTGASSTASAAVNGQVTFTLCESLLLNGIFTSAYSNYRIIWAGFASTGAILNARMSVGGTPSSAASYNRQQLVASNTTLAGIRETGQTSWNIANNISATDGENFSMDIFNPQLAKNTSLNVLSFSTVSSGYWQSVGAYFTATTVFDGIQFIPSTGNFSGTVSVYGYNQ
jgi:hypothetical protein